MPLFTLRVSPRDDPSKTRGQDGFAISFPVRLFHSPLHAGLSRRTTGMHKRKISAVAAATHNHNQSLLLRRNWLRSARPCATRLNLCASVTPLARNQTVPPKTRILKQNREVRFFRFTPGALLPRRPTGIRVDLCPMSSAIRAQECTNPNWLPFAKTQSASADCASGA